jgi:hypothetical protein
MARRVQRIVVQDQATQRALLEHERVLGELVDENPTHTVVEANLPDATAVTVRHGLGRRMKFFSVSPPIGATATGRIVRSVGDDSNHVILTATGFGATVTVLLRFE